MRREIEVWVTEYDIKKLDPDGTDTISIYSKKCGDSMFKATLTIEEEREVTIKESEFDNILDHALDSADDLKHGDHDEFKSILKQRLFNKGQE